MVSVIIPTFNAAPFLPALLKALKQQTLQHELIIIDSGSTDDTREILEKENVNLINIRKSSFNHGATRNLGVKASKFSIVIFMTQDALPASINSLDRLVFMLQSRSDVAMAYGRQLPYPNTGIFGQLARITNYPDYSMIKTRSSIPFLGIKTCSCSNSFAAYYKSSLEEVGEFPTDTILGEDVSVAARLILNNRAVAYSAEATVYHSHDYTIIEEFKRYFDIGAFHKSQNSVLCEFSKAESEGIKYVFQELNFLINRGRYILIPVQLVRSALKYVGYKLGFWNNILPKYIKKKLSMHSEFWL